MKYLLNILLCVWLLSSGIALAQSTDSVEVSQQLQLNILPKLDYPLNGKPSFKKLKKYLPVPIIKRNKTLEKMYWYAWEKAFAEIHLASQSKGLAYNYLKQADKATIDQWHTMFCMHFWKYGSRAYNAIQSLDNFYNLQQMDGYICREIDPANGKNFYGKGKTYSVAAPLLTWTEWEWYKCTGDLERVKRVIDPLSFQIEWLEQNQALPKEAGNTHYFNSEEGSGIKGIYRTKIANIDMTAQMALTYLFAEKLVKLTPNSSYGPSYLERYETIKETICEDFYFQFLGFTDLDCKREAVEKLTIHGLWPRLAGIEGFKQFRFSAPYYQSKPDNSYGGTKIGFVSNMPLATHTLSDTAFVNSNAYGKTTVHGELNYMAIQALTGNNTNTDSSKMKFYECKHLIRTMQNKLALNFEKTGKLWQYYQAKTGEQGLGASAETLDGTPLMAINFLIENYLGITVEGYKSQITWQLNCAEGEGIKNLKVGNAIVSLMKGKINEKSDYIPVTITTTEPITILLKFGDRVLYQKLAKGSYKFKV